MEPTHGFTLTIGSYNPVALREMNKISSGFAAGVLMVSLSGLFSQAIFRILNV
jgi:hypothetical protein